jgi:hypothetical protein
MIAFRSPNDKAAKLDETDQLPLVSVDRSRSKAIRAREDREARKIGAANPRDSRLSGRD